MGGAYQQCQSCRASAPSVFSCVTRSSRRHGGGLLFWPPPHSSWRDVHRAHVGFARANFLHVAVTVNLLAGPHRGGDDHFRVANFQVTTEAVNSSVNLILTWRPLGHADT